MCIIPSNNHRIFLINIVYEINNINHLMHQIHHEPEDDVVMDDVEVQQVVEVEQERRYPGRERRQPPHLRDYQT